MPRDEARSEREPLITMLRTIGKGLDLQPNEKVIAVRAWNAAIDAATTTMFAEFERMYVWAGCKPMQAAQAAKDVTLALKGDRNVEQSGTE